MEEWYESALSQQACIWAWEDLQIRACKKLFVRLDALVCLRTSPGKGKVRYNEQHMILSGYMETGIFVAGLHQFLLRYLLVFQLLSCTCY